MGINRCEREKFDDYKKYIGQLEGEYLTTFQKIEVYIDGSTKLSILEKNDCFLQIMDTFLSSQAGGKSVKDITGTNLKKYCDNMIYGESIYIYKASRICSIILDVLFYLSFMHFFSAFFKAIRLKDSSIIFQPMNFGIAEIILALSYICIPKLISFITKNYFENPALCKKVKRYTYHGIWIFTIIIYTSIKESFNQHGVKLSFSNLVLVLIYLTIVSISVWLLTKVFNDEMRANDMESKYIEQLNKEYEKYKVKCEKQNKSPLDKYDFVKIRNKKNSLYVILFFIYSIIFLALGFLIAKGMLGKGNIDVIGIIILLGVSFLFVVMISVVVEGIRRNKYLEQI